eukprot:793706-Pelagomonas_calceolata.AAC.7
MHVKWLKSHMHRITWMQKSHTRWTKGNMHRTTKLHEMHIKMNGRPDAQDHKIAGNMHRMVVESS